MKRHASRYPRSVYAVTVLVASGAIAMLAGLFVVAGKAGPRSFGHARKALDQTVSPTVVAAKGRPLATNLSPAPSAVPTSPTPSAGSDAAAARRFAASFATSLFSYDTRTQSESAWCAGLLTGLDPSADVRSENQADLASRTPPVSAWQAMADAKQYATFAVSRTWIPALWVDNAGQYPVGATAVTVSGTQQLVWRGGSSEVVQQITLLLMCPPANDACVVNRIAAQVAQ